MGINCMSLAVWLGEDRKCSAAVPAPIALLSEFFCFALSEIFFRPRREPVCRLFQFPKRYNNQNVLYQILIALDQKANYNVISQER